MRDIVVTYTLSDKEEERLKKITDEYKKQGLKLSEDKQFNYIMCCGSSHDIDKKFKYHEWTLGLRENYR